MAFIAADWSASAFLRADAGGRASWCFLSQLTTVTGLPGDVADFVQDLSKRVSHAQLNVQRMDEQGMLTERQQMVFIVSHLEEQRAQLMRPFESSEPHHCKLRRDLQQKLVPSAKNALPVISGSGAGMFEVRDIPGKGVGVIALRDINPGERILCEPPLVWWEVLPSGRDRGSGIDSSCGSPDSIGNGRSPRIDQAQLEALVGELGASDRCAFLALCDVHTTSVNNDPGADTKTPHGIWASNAFTIHEGDSVLPMDDGVLRAAVFRSAARLNHSCVPCCHAAWSPSARMQTVHAAKGIKRGDELTIAYLGETASKTREERRAELASRYHFTCQCEACMWRGKRLERSERRRKRIGELSAAVLGDGKNAGRGGGREGGPKMESRGDVPSRVEELCTLADAEGLPLVWHRYAIIAAMRAAKESGDVAAALKWAERGAQSARLTLGADAPATTTFEMVVKLWSRKA